MSNFLKSFIRDESGATAIEYGLIAAGIAVAVAAAVQVFGTAVETGFTNLGNTLVTATL